VLLIAGKNVRRFLFFPVCSIVSSQRTGGAFERFSVLPYRADLAKRTVAFDGDARSTLASNANSPIADNSTRNPTIKKANLCPRMTGRYAEIDFAKSRAAVNDDPFEETDATGDSANQLRITCIAYAIVLGKYLFRLIIVSSR